MANPLLPLSNRALIKLQFPGDASFDSRTKGNFGGGYRTLESDIDVPDNCLTAGQNTRINGNSLSKRKGPINFGSFSGGTTGILGQVAHEPPGGTAELLRVYDTSVLRYVAGIWTALTGVTMTTGLKAEAAYFPLTAKTYITNGTDQVVKYASGAAGDQTDAAFKKGKYIVEYKNRLIVAGVSSQTDYFWYSDLGVDTFSANNYVRVNGEITGLTVLFDKLIIATKKRIYVVNNFSFNGVAAGPESVIPLRGGDIGCISQRTMQVVGNIMYFLGLNAEGVAAIYATDGTTIGNTPTSRPIEPDMALLAPNSLTNACAGIWGNSYRLSVTPTGQTVNTRELVYDTINQRFDPPYTNGVGGYSVYTPWTVSGNRQLYGGNQTYGLTHLLDTVNYDETINQSYLTGQDTDGPVDGSPAKRAAQSFMLSAGQTATYKVTGVAVYMKKNAGTTTGLTVRIETSSASKPSGTLANANLTSTIAAFTGTSYDWRYASFTTPAALTTGTSYWLVVQHTTEGSGTSQYYWGYDNSSPTYANGNGASYATGAWTAQATADYLFVVFYEADIDGYADTKALVLGPEGQMVHLRDFFATLEATDGGLLQVGVNIGTYSSFQLLDLDTSSTGPLFGSTLVIGTSVLGGKRRAEGRLRWDAIRGYVLKFRFRNRFANGPFTVDSYRTRHQVINKMK